MPRMNGLEFLDAITCDTELKDVSVLVFATPDMHPLIAAKYGQCLRGFLDKDRAEETLSQALATLTQHNPTTGASP